ncbi:Early nodulin-like protein 2, partial [Cucurbita argyrosperma subsp. sororia]
MASLLCLCILFFPCFLSVSHAYTFYAGGKDGWVLNPSERYDNWSHRNRFQVNDVIVFKYAKGLDSVLVVSKEGYEKCDLKNPIMKLEDGNSEFKFDRSGPFYFVSGKQGSCEKGQKLMVVVLAQRPPPPYTVGAPPPSGAAPSYSPPVLPSPPQAKPPGVSPSPPSGSPGAKSPSGSPPSATPISPSPPSGTPTSPSPSGSHSPAPSGSHSPGGAKSPSGSPPSGTPSSPSPSFSFSWFAVSWSEISFWFPAVGDT